MSRIYTLAEVSSMMQQDYPAGASVLVARLDPSVRADMCEFLYARAGSERENELCAERQYY